MTERLPINKAPPKRVYVETALDRLRAAWAEADELERRIFRMSVMEQEEK